MLPISVLLSLVAAASAQNYSFPKGFDPGQIDLGTRCTFFFSSYINMRNMSLDTD